MPEFPGETENREKDSIIARSPLLRVFIDPLIRTDPRRWFQIFSVAFLNIGREVTSVVSEVVQNQDINLYLRVSKECMVFNKDVAQDTKFALIAAFAWMGYEIGSKDKFPLFIDDIMDNLSAHEAVNITQETKDFFEEVMALGTLWKRDIEDETPELFRKGVANLNLDDL